MYLNATTTVKASLNDTINHIPISQNIIGSNTINTTINTTPLNADIIADVFASSIAVKYTDEKIFNPFTIKAIE